MSSTSSTSQSGEEFDEEEEDDGYYQDDDDVDDDDDDDDDDDMGFGSEVKAKETYVNVSLHGYPYKACYNVCLLKHASLVL